MKTKKISVKDLSVEEVRRNFEHCGRNWNYFYNLLDSDCCPLEIVRYIHKKVNEIRDLGVIKMYSLSVAKAYENHNELDAAESIYSKFNCWGFLWKIREKKGDINGAKEAFNKLESFYVINLLDFVKKLLYYSFEGKDLEDKVKSIIEKKIPIRHSSHPYHLNLNESYTQLSKALNLLPDKSKEKVLDDIIVEHEQEIKTDTDDDKILTLGVLYEVRGDSDKALEKYSESGNISTLAGRYKAIQERKEEISKRIKNLIYKSVNKTLDSSLNLEYKWQEESLIEDVIALDEPFLAKSYALYLIRKYELERRYTCCIDIARKTKNQGLVMKYQRFIKKEEAEKERIKRIINLEE